MYFLYRKRKNPEVITTQLPIVGTSFSVDRTLIFPWPKAQTYYCLIRISVMCVCHDPLRHCANEGLQSSDGYQDKCRRAQ